MTLTQLHALCIGDTVEVAEENEFDGEIVRPAKGSPYVEAQIAEITRAVDGIAFRICPQEKMRRDAFLVLPGDLHVRLPLKE